MEVHSSKIKPPIDFSYSMTGSSFEIIKFEKNLDILSIDNQPI